MYVKDLFCSGAQGRQGRGVPVVRAGGRHQRRRPRRGESGDPSGRQATLTHACTQERTSQPRLNTEDKTGSTRDYHRRPHRGQLAINFVWTTIRAIRNDYDKNPYTGCFQIRAKEFE